MKHKRFTAAFRAQNSVTIHDRRRQNRVRLSGEENAPRNVCIPQSRVVASTHTNAEIRDAMTAPSHVSTKKLAKSGCTIQDTMNATLWRDKL